MTNTLWRILGFGSFILLWWSAALWLNDDILPSPATVMHTIIHHTLHGELIHHSLVTMGRVIISFIIAMSVGSAIGILMGRNTIINSAFDDLLILALNMPALVTIILCYIWVGLNDTAAILAVAINKIPLVVINLREGARALNKDLLEVGAVYRLSSIRILRLIILPQLYPYMMAAARSGLSLIWKIVLVVELLGRSDGIGFQLHHFFQFFDIAAILAYSFAFIFFIILIEAFLLRPLETHINRWRK